jgi:hypothetical protein
MLGRASREANLQASSLKTGKKERNLEIQWNTSKDTKETTTFPFLSSMSLSKKTLKDSLLSLAEIKRPLVFLFISREYLMKVLMKVLMKEGEEISKSTTST